MFGRSCMKNYQEAYDFYSSLECHEIFGNKVGMPEVKRESIAQQGAPADDRTSRR